MGTSQHGASTAGTPRVSPDRAGVIRRRRPARRSLVATGLRQAVVRAARFEAQRWWWLWSVVQWTSLYNGPSEVTRGRRGSVVLQTEHARATECGRFAKTCGPEEFDHHPTEQDKLQKSSDSISLVFFRPGHQLTSNSPIVTLRLATVQEKWANNWSLSSTAR